MESKPNPRRTAGERYLWCKLYDECLDLAVSEWWETFNCESCDYYDAWAAENSIRLTTAQKKRCIYYHCSNLGICLFMKLNEVEGIDCNGCERFDITAESVKNAPLVRDIVNGVSCGTVDVKCMSFGVCYEKALCEISKIDCRRCKQGLTDDP